MYVCICNALTDKTLAAKAGTDTTSVGEVFRRCGEKPQCGKCLPDIAKIIEENRISTSTNRLAAE